ncbi:MAG: site-specific DNA-methyltransferase [Brevundimonas sp.]|nr:MAG: site-specific DNA-methyltransferase [Brevundimonas sp.]
MTLSRAAARAPHVDVAGLLAASDEFVSLTGLGVTPNPSGNAVVYGENLSVLSALSGELQGTVDCIYIDPPYNNNETYTHYQDKWLRADWLNGLAARLRLMKPLLALSGSIWISIDDSEVHHVRLAAEEVFGPENFVTTIIWNHRKSRENRKVFSNNHEYILCFARHAPSFKAKRNGLPATDEILGRYRNPDDDARGPWQSVSANVQAGHATPAQFYTVVSPAGISFDPPKGRCWSYNKLRMDREIALGNIYFGRTGQSAPRIKKFLSEAKLTVTPSTLWMADDVGTTDQAKKHLMSVLREEEVFDTPKPEELIYRILAIATDPGDLVLDAYLGSGTTASVAHKTDRRYLGLEQGDHALSHCSARLRAVVAGEGGGISRVAGWSGGGGFEIFSHEPADRHDQAHD